MLAVLNVALSAFTLRLQHTPCSSLPAARAWCARTAPLVALSTENNPEAMTTAEQIASLEGLLNSNVMKTSAPEEIAMLRAELDRLYVERFKSEISSAQSDAAVQAQMAAAEAAQAAQAQAAQAQAAAQAAAQQQQQAAQQQQQAAQQQQQAQAQAQQQVAEQAAMAAAEAAFAQAAAVEFEDGQRDPRRAPPWITENQGLLDEMAAESKPIKPATMSASRKVSPIFDLADFEAAVRAAEAADRMIVVKYFSQSCRACMTMKPLYERAAESKLNELVDFYEIDQSASRVLCTLANVNKVGAQGCAQGYPVPPDASSRCRSTLPQHAATARCSSGGLPTGCCLPLPFGYRIT